MSDRRPFVKRLLGPPYRALRRFAAPWHPRLWAVTARWLMEILRTIRRRRRERRLTIAVDVAAFWEPLAGVGWYLYRLLEQLAERDDLALRLYGPSLAAGPGAPLPAVEPPRGPAIEWVAYRPPQDGVVHPDRFVRLLRLLSPFLIALDGNQLVFAPNFFPPRRFGLATGRLVATVHDLAYRRVPWAVRRETLEELGRHLDRVWYRADRVITDSRAVAAEMAEEGLAPPERVRPIHLAAAHPPRPDGTPPAGTPERFALFVGTVEPRKNVSTLLAAWRRLRADAGAEAPALVLCGRFGWESEALRRELDRAAGEGWLHHFGYVEDAELGALYRRALCLVFPTHYEGFGLPLLEAMAAGVPVLASDLPVLRELGADAARYLPPRDPEAWARAVAELADAPEERTRLATAGRARAAEFSWAAAAERHAEVFREVARDAFG